jgi:hypothetical protein
LLLLRMSCSHTPSDFDLINLLTRSLTLQKSHYELAAWFIKTRSWDFFF